MIGDYYVSTGITVCPMGSGQWSVRMQFLDAGFCDHGSTEGKLYLRYLVTEGELPAALITLKNDAERLGIRWDSKVPGCPTVYMEGDGEGTNERGEPRPYPSDWQTLVADLARHLRWQTSYAEAI